MKVNLVMEGKKSKEVAKGEDVEGRNLREAKRMPEEETPRRRRRVMKR